MCRAEGVCAREKKHMYECEIQYYCVREREWIIVHERKGESTEQTLLFCNAEWLTTTEKKTALLFLIMSSEIMSYLFNHPPPPRKRERLQANKPAIIRNQKGCFISLLIMIIRHQECHASTHRRRLDGGIG